MFIVSIDGIRCHEAFAYDFQQDEPEHPYMPFIWNTLKPQGTAFMEMYNDVCTFTSPGHATMLTGAWQMFPNYAGREDTTFQTRAWEPTIFEYARKDLGFQQWDTWCVVGKTNCLENDWSIHPEYGEEHGANLVQVPTFIDVPETCYSIESLPDVDSMTVDSLMVILDRDTPSLVFVNLRAVDEAAHLDNPLCGFWVYEEAIRRADRAVERIWEYISDPENEHYVGRTTLIVTTDHGRHDVGFTDDYKGHGGICHGCRHVMCLVVGPDTPPYTEVERRTYQVDIAPTIRELLGGDGGIARYAEGQVLREAIEGHSKPDGLIQRNPACDIYGEEGDTGDVVWADH